MQGQELTFAILGRTRNEAAVDVLLACLDSDLQENREQALGTLMLRQCELKNTTFQLQILVI